jgi:hypothetical protein
MPLDRPRGRCRLAEQRSFRELVTRARRSSAGGVRADESSAMSHASSDPTRRAPGQHVRAASLRLRLRTLVILGVIAIASAACARALGLRDVRFLAIELVLAFALLAVAHYVVPLVRRRDLGAGGEELVGGVLATLGGEWSVIHDATLGHGNVDHIVIGPGGVFAIETKSRAGHVRVRDIHGGTIYQARAHCAALEEICGRPVEPLLVFSRAWVDRPLSRRGGVRVLPARMLAKHLRSRPVALAPADVERVHALIGTALRARASQAPAPHASSARAPLASSPRRVLRSRSRVGARFDV